jgi:hypothetical protein
LPRMRWRLLLPPVLETPCIISSSRLTCSCTALVYRWLMAVITTIMIPRGRYALKLLRAPPTRTAIFWKLGVVISWRLNIALSLQCHTTPQSHNHFQYL